MSSPPGVGCCGFPRARADYYRTFPVVEVQQTFYHPPRPSTARRWREEAPEGFEFTLKAWQLITHQPTSPTYRRARVRIAPEERDLYGAFRWTDPVRRAWDACLQIAAALQARMVVFQCPASFDPRAEHLDNLRRFMDRADRAGLTFAWEPWGEGWTDERVTGLCAELDLIHCVDPFQRSPAHGEPRYFRLHGRGGFRYRYTDEDLERLEGWLREAPGYALFNNAHMWEDAERLLRSLAQPEG